MNSIIFIINYIEFYLQQSTNTNGKTLDVEPHLLDKIDGIVLIIMADISY